MTTEIEIDTALPAPYRIMATDGCQTLILYDPADKAVASVHDGADAARALAAAPVMLAALRMYHMAADAVAWPHGERADEALQLAQVLAAPVAPVTHIQAREIAQQWHSVMTWADPGVSVYAFGSSGRCRDSDDYRLAVSELSKSRDWLLPRLLSGVSSDPSVDDLAKLESLIWYLQHRAEGAARRVDGLDDFTRSYMAAALWSTHDESNDAGGEPMDANYRLQDIALPTFKRMVLDCTKFRSADLTEYRQITGESMTACGHDFWLTRNGHGAGFWDRGAGEVGERLTEAAKKFGEAELYIGDDLQVWQCGAETFGSAG